MVLHSFPLRYRAWLRSISPRLAACRVCQCQICGVVWREPSEWFERLERLSSRVTVLRFVYWNGDVIYLSYHFSILHLISSRACLLELSPRYPTTTSSHTPFIHFPQPPPLTTTKHAPLPHLPNGIPPPNQHILLPLRPPTPRLQIHRLPKPTRPSAIRWLRHHNPRLLHRPRNARRPCRCSTHCLSRPLAESSA